MTTNLHLLLAAGVVSALTVLGCGHTAMVHEGAYKTAFQQNVPDDQQGAMQSAKVKLDRKAKQLTLALEDGTKVQKAFTIREKETWPKGCSGAFSAASLEVIDVPGPLTVGALTLAHPVLVASCQSDGFFLREDDGQLAVSCFNTSVVCIKLVPEK